MFMCKKASLSGENLCAIIMYVRTLFVKMNITEHFNMLGDVRIDIINAIIYCFEPEYYYV